MKPIRHRSPKTENTFANNIFQSPKKKHINIINIDKGRNIINNRNIGLNNQFNFNYNKNDYNYYAEITKAFNFITYVLKQKDIQIKELKTKINNLQKQLNDINESNIMTFYNQEILDSSNQNNNLKLLNKKNNINFISPDNNKSKVRQMMNNFCSAQAEVNSINTTNSNNNSNNNIFITKNNFGNVGADNNSINKIQKINNSTNINKINNYRNIETGKINNNNKIYNFNKFSNENENNQINLNMNEHSTDKTNINQIRNESYHSNQNINVRNYNNENMKGTKYGEAKTDTESLMGTDKIKILTFENSMYNAGKPGSKSNSFNMSDDGNAITSKQDVKNYLKEVKTKLAPEKFKKFITNIKLLTKNKNPTQRNEIILQIKSLLIDKNLINKFESIMKIKKN